MSTSQPKRVIALGFFDGVHIGHGALLRRTVEASAELGAVPAALTFDAHPMSLTAHRPTPLLTTAADRAALMAELYGVEEVILAHFDDSMMHMPWEDFITGYLIRQHGAVHLVAGHDFRFGWKGEGTAERLAARCARLGVGCDIIPAVTLDGVTVSSTHIRSLLEAGDIEAADRFLGHPHILSGTVAHGRGLGSTLGFPTVNLPLPAPLLSPARGVYAARVRLADGGRHSAVVNIGVRPTVDCGGGVTAEAFLLDYHGDLYGQSLRLELYHFLRPERKFPSLEALRAEVLRNAEQARRYFEAK